VRFPGKQVMSIIKGKVLYSRDKLEEPAVDLGGHPNFGEFILSHLAADPTIREQVWLVNAGYDLTGVNRASCVRGMCWCEQHWAGSCKGWCSFRQLSKLAPGRTGQPMNGWSRAVKHCSVCCMLEV